MPAGFTCTAPRGICICICICICIVYVYTCTARRDLETLRPQPQWGQAARRGESAWQMRCLGLSPGYSTVTRPTLQGSARVPAREQGHSAKTRAFRSHQPSKPLRIGPDRNCTRASRPDCTHNPSQEELLTTKLLTTKLLTTKHLTTKLYLDRRTLKQIPFTKGA